MDLDKGNLYTVFLKATRQLIYSLGSEIPLLHEFKNSIQRLNEHENIPPEDLPLHEIASYAKTREAVPRPLPAKTVKWDNILRT